MARLFLVSALLLTLAACTFFRAPGRDDCDKILGREKMADILTDIYLLEAFMLEYQHIERRIRDSANHYYRGIFDHYGIDPADFDEALSCYLLDIHEMERIHEKMLSRLSIMESEAGQLPPMEEPARGLFQEPPQ